MSFFGCALLGDRGGWRVEEVDILECESVDDLLELLRDFDEPVRVLALEQDDEYAALIRFDTARGDDDELVRVFLTSGHAGDDYPLAGLLLAGLTEIGGDPLDDDELADDVTRSAHDDAPFGDADLIADLGLKAPELIELAVHESTLPIDLIEAVCERLGCLDEFEAVRV
ncbi:tRNA adenosine deaminase-associated protein [Jatrophihabitans sp. DSM 45814]